MADDRHICHLGDKYGTRKRSRMSKVEYKEKLGVYESVNALVILPIRTL